MREIEVLHDQLCAVLEDPRIEPHDIVVMTPDIETYAPVIEAVFGQKSGRPQLPYSVSDRKTRTTHEVVDALYALTEALSGRLSASSVLDLLTLRLHPHALRDRERGARHAARLDRAAARSAGASTPSTASRSASPASRDNTWRFGLTRMLLGYAIEGRGQRLYQGVLPLDEIEGGAGELLGKLAELCERLFRAPRRTARAARDAGVATTRCSRCSRTWCTPGPSTAHEHQLIARRARRA